MSDYADFLRSKAWESGACGMAGDVSIDDRMFPFQQDIVRWAIRRGRACLFEDCGLGKTFQQLAWAKNVPGDVLIVAPLAVSLQTVAEGERFGIECAVSKDGAKKGKITVTNYERLHHFDHSSFEGVVLDESSILKSHTGHYKQFIIDAFSDTRFKMCCTATPAPNDIMELANHAEFMGAMKRQEFLATWFVHDGGDTAKWRLKKHAEVPFWRWMATWAVVMRKPSDLGYSDEGFDLPPLMVHQHEIETGITEDGMLFATPAQTLNEQRRARKLTMPVRIDKVVQITADGGPWVVWCELNAESTELASAIEGAVEVAGSDSPEKKESAFMAFSDGEIRVLVTKPKMAAHGLNWQHCSKQCFAGLSHSFEQTYQAMRRSWRFGQEKPVDAHIVVTDIESGVAENVEKKRKAHEFMVERMAAVMSESSMAEIHGTERSTLDYSNAEEKSDKWTMILGDSVEEVASIDDNSVGLSVFSPPFAQLYTYSASDRDMGNSRDYLEFMAHFGYLIDELKRIMMPGRNICVHCMDLPIFKGVDGFVGLRDFPGIIARAFEERDLYLHSKVTIWKDPVVAMQRTKAIGLLWKQIKKDSTMSRMGFPDYVLTFKKHGDNPEPVSHSAEDFPVAQWQEWASPVWMDINQSDTLQKQSARDEKDERHIAPLQLEVIRRCVRLWSNPGDLVFSPFAGIGSEGYVALQEQRRFIGVELKESYYNQACANLKSAWKQKELF